VLARLPGYRLPIGWCYWDYLVVAISLYHVVGSLTHDIPTKLEATKRHPVGHKDRCSSVWGSANAGNFPPPGAGAWQRRANGDGEGIRFLFGARGGAPPQAGGAPPGAWPCSGGAPIEKNGRFRWAIEGCWGLQTGYGVGKGALN
jgi:hypothetical protein